MKKYLKTQLKKFDEIKLLSDVIKHNQLNYYLKGNRARKRFNDLNNGIELFRKIGPG